MEEENLEEVSGDTEDENESKKSFCECLYSTIRWSKMLATEMHWSIVFGVLVVSGISKGLGGALFRVSTEYYMKDVHKVQPSEAQIYAGITSIPWIVKPIWGLLTDVLPILGYRRRPYFIFAGFSRGDLHAFVVIAQKVTSCFGLIVINSGKCWGGNSGCETVDACVAQDCIRQPSLAANMQSLCTLSGAIGALVGFFISVIFVHLIGPKGVFGLLTTPAGFLVEILLHDPHVPNFSYRQEDVGYLFSVGSVGALMGKIIYQNFLKDYPFQALLFWTQLLFGLSGMLDLILVLRLNMKFGVSDYLFVVIDESVYQMIGRLKWMPLLLSSKLCPSGIAGTFFALLMCYKYVNTFI